MNSKAWLLAGVSAACALGATVWILQTGNTSTTERKAPISGPQPEATVEHTVYDFGTMAVHEKGTHVFVIKNTGEAPLTVEKGSTTCKCTLSKLEKGQLQPGESAEIELEWTPKDRSNMFQQEAKIKTNDPFRKMIKLTVRGRVDTVVHIEPAGNWEFGQIKNHWESEMSGYMFSPVLEDFNILSIESSDPAMVAEFAPMDDAARERLKAKSGYAIHAKLVDQIPIGKYQEWLTFQTDIQGRLPDGRNLPEGKGLVLMVNVTGIRQGPMSILGPGWSSHDMTLRMGTFPADEGKDATLSLFLTDLDEISDFRVEDFEIQGIEPSLKFLEVTAEEDRDFTAEGRKKLNLHIEVPPGSPPFRATDDSGAKVTFRTNHPGASEFDIFVRFVAR